MMLSIERLRPLAVRLFLVIFATAFAKEQLPAAEPDIVRALQIWRDYQGIQVQGTYEEVNAGAVVVRKRFLCSFGHSDRNNGFVPRSIETFISNPGEPHIRDEWICDYFAAVKDGVTAHFNRRFVSKDKSTNTLSRITVQPGNHLLATGDKAATCAIDAIVASSLINFHYDDTPLPKNLEFLKTYSLGEEMEFLGIKGRILEVKVGDDSPAEKMRGVVYRQLVAFEPTVRVLKYLDVTGPNSDVCEIINAERRLHKIKKLEVISGMLFPTLVEVGTESSFYRYTIDSANPIAENFHGLWNWDGPRGTVWNGDLEPTIRKEGVHQKVRFGTGSVIPYTAEEEEAIRQYLVKHSVPVILPAATWTSIFFYVASLATLLCVSVVIYRKLRGSA